MTETHGDDVPVEVGLYDVTKRFGPVAAVDDVTIEVGVASRCWGRRAAARRPRCA